MYELKREEFINVKNILDETMDNIEIKAVINNENPGWIFVDSKENPKTAVIYSKGVGGFYFVGDEKNESFNKNIEKYIDEDIKKRAVKEGFDEFEFSGETEKWNVVLEEIFKNKDLKQSVQYIYKLDRDEWDKHEKRDLYEGFELKKMDMELFNSKNFENLEFLNLEVLKWWNSFEDYVNNTFGYCVVKDNKVANFCMCDYVNDKYSPMGIETIEEFRRKGICQVSTEAYIEEALRRNKQPYWECMGTNVASQKLAEKLGFRRHRSYNLYYFKF